MMASSPTSWLKSSCAMPENSKKSCQHRWNTMAEPKLVRPIATPDRNADTPMHSTTAQSGRSAIVRSSSGAVPFPDASAIHALPVCAPTSAAAASAAASASGSRSGCAGCWVVDRFRICRSLSSWSLSRPPSIRRSNGLGLPFRRSSRSSRTLFAAAGAPSAGASANRGAAAKCCCSECSAAPNCSARALEAQVANPTQSISTIIFISIIVVVVVVILSMEVRAEDDDRIHPFCLLCKSGTENCRSKTSSKQVWVSCDLALCVQHCRCMCFVL
ncbi:hypothetical protein CAOG_009691 [Capsaspora owczarzaki ATCC 30864]|uniref:Uncharacterized protein n=1 Tax=Capsaspora owczarzaki (strain ATCC 30864) TaxID=595528 RepID=A0A0D2X2J5_CAPO3|nr:hypothetical protein CAOG_009691 [Capsaspora owczarzaki ATCC 30864]